MGLQELAKPMPKAKTRATAKRPKPTPPHEQAPSARSTPIKSPEVKRAKASEVESPAVKTRLFTSDEGATQEAAVPRASDHAAELAVGLSQQPAEPMEVDIQPEKQGLVHPETTSNNAP